MRERGGDLFAAGDYGCASFFIEGDGNAFGIGIIGAVFVEGEACAVSS